jgi:hypothetical protein
MIKRLKIYANFVLAIFVLFRILENLDAAWLQREVCSRIYLAFCLIAVNSEPSQLRM